MTAVSLRPLSLAADTAADLMAPDPPALSSDATLHEVLAALIDHNVNVAPVVGDHGEPVGVLGLTDLLIHVRASVPDAAGGARVAPATAADLMTPTVFAVDAHTPAADVVADMVRSRVHHLFVTDAAGKIVGVVSACDVLRRLQ
jgi:CBS-domain-containing membrane protein